MRRMQKAPEHAMRLQVRRIVAGLILALAVSLVAGCGYVRSAPPTGSAGAQTVQVTLADFSITSSFTTFQMDTPYHFVVTNTGHTDHEWMVGPPMMADMPMSQMHAMALMHINMVHPGQTETIDYMFHQMPMSQQTSLEMACHLPGHYEAGMKLPINVQ